MTVAIAAERIWHHQGPKGFVRREGQSQLVRLANGYISVTRGGLLLNSIHPWWRKIHSVDSTRFRRIDEATNSEEKRS